MREVTNQIVPFRASLGRFLSYFRVIVGANNVACNFGKAVV